MFESAALILHIADLDLEAGLIGPLGSYERALQYQWCFFGMTEIEGALMDIARQLWKDGDPIAGGRRARDGALRRGGRRRSRQALGDDDYLVDDIFSVADIVVGSVLAFARTGELTELPAGVRAVRRPPGGAAGAAARGRGRPARARARRMHAPARRDQARGPPPSRRLPPQSAGAFSAASPDMPVLLLTTTGRRTGRRDDDAAHVLRDGRRHRGRRLERRRGQRRRPGG